MSSQRYQPGVAGLRGAFTSVEASAKEPVLFQVLSPDEETLLFPIALFFHINPNSLSPSYTKLISTTQTRGGFLEQHWGEQLTEISSEQVSGALINVESGLAVRRRRETLAAYRFNLLEDLFHNNANVYDAQGNIVYKGYVRITFRGGIYDGYFSSLSITEDASQPFLITATWSFKVIKEARTLIY